MATENHSKLRNNVRIRLCFITIHCARMGQQSYTDGTQMLSMSKGLHAHDAHGHAREPVSVQKIFRSSHGPARNQTENWTYSNSRRKSHGSGKIAIEMKNSSCLHLPITVSSVMWLHTSIRRNDKSVWMYPADTRFYASVLTRRRRHTILLRWRFVRRF